MRLFASLQRCRTIASRHVALSSPGIVHEAYDNMSRRSQLAYIDVWLKSGTIFLAQPRLDLGITNLSGVSSATRTGATLAWACAPHCGKIEPELVRVAGTSRHGRQVRASCTMRRHLLWRDGAAAPCKRCSCNGSPGCQSIEHGVDVKESRTAGGAQRNTATGRTAASTRAAHLRLQQRARSGTSVRFQRCCDPARRPRPHGCCSPWWPRTRARPNGGGPRGRLPTTRTPHSCSHQATSRLAAPRAPQATSRQMEPESQVRRGPSAARRQQGLRGC
jgi:hypothetical protein